MKVKNVCMCVLAELAYRIKHEESSCVHLLLFMIRYTWHAKEVLPFKVQSVIIERHVSECLKNG